MKKWLIALAVILLLSLPVCIALFGSGYLSCFNPDISAEQVAAIQVTDGMQTGETFEVTDAEAIRQISALVNDLGPAVGRYGTWNGWHYSVTFLDDSGAELFHVTAVDDNQISSGNYYYPADASELIACLAELDMQNP